jgi:hypothetical protein
MRFVAHVAPRQWRAAAQAQEPAPPSPHYPADPFGQEVVMAAFDDSNDFGAIVIAVVVATVAAGAFIYAWNRAGVVQTALNVPSIERTIPDIVPNQPMF